MWRLLIVALIALIPLGMSIMVEHTGHRVSFEPWLGRPVRTIADTGQRPPPDWQERAYLAANPDVAAAVREGAFFSGYEHYIASGQREGRRGGFAVQRAVAEVPAR